MSSITCPKCGKTSYHPQDVQYRYCGNCHQYHDSMELMMSASRCAHVFEKTARWPKKMRWTCAKCGFVTRHYDSVDRAGTRPIHQHMSVAYKGFNTQ